MIQDIFYTVVVMSIISSVLWITLLIAKPIISKIFSATWQYHTRIIIVAFLIIPVGILGNKLFFQLSNNFVLTQIDFNLNRSILSPNYNILDTEINKYTMFVDKFILFISYIWFAGVFIFVLYKMFRFAIYTYKMKQTSFVIENISIIRSFNHCKASMRINRQILLLSNDMIKSPRLMGLLKPKLFIPEVYIDKKELELIFTHELIHFKHKDLYLKWFVVLTNALHWFNPLIYFLSKDIDILCELSCDEAVVSDMNYDERHFYGEMILNMLDRTVNNSIYTPLCENNKTIKQRLLLMMSSKKTSKLMAVISTIVIFILTLTGLTTTTFVQVSFDLKNNFDNQLSLLQNSSLKIYREYIKFGIEYKQKSNELFYNGKSIKLFVDEKEIENSPFDKSFNLLFNNTNTNSNLYLKAIRNEQNIITGIEYLSQHKAEEILNTLNRVTFNGNLQISNILYSNDKQNNNLDINDVDNHTRIVRQKSKNGEKATIYYDGERCAYNIQIDKEDKLNIYLFDVENLFEGDYTVINYFSKKSFDDINLYFNNKKIDYVLIEK